MAKNENDKVVCDRCKKEADYHGYFVIDKEFLCWYCFKKQEIKDGHEDEDEESEVEKWNLE